MYSEENPLDFCLPVPCLYPYERVILLIVFLFFKITLVVHQFVCSIQILRLHILERILIIQFCIFLVNLSFPDTCPFVKTVEYRYTKCNPQSGRRIPVIGRSGMEPVAGLIRICGIHPASGQCQRRKVALTNQILLLPSQFLL